jgi:FMN phosphatase YigB (HAD superfamily)
MLYNIGMEKIILTDADGVLLDWEWAFHVWMQERGYVTKPDGKMSYYLHDHFEDLTWQEAKKLIRIFNESAAIGFLPSLRDSTYYVKRLHEEHGFKFHCITSLSKDVNAQRLREMNIKKIFGPTAFEKFVFLDTGADKDDALKEYEGSGLYWLEDKPENSDVGHALGLKSILVEHGHNMNHTCPYPVVKNWKQIYNIITEGENDE